MSNEPKPVVWRGRLNQSQIEVFRAEYLSIERDIQRFITIYLSAIGVGISWLIGPGKLDIAYAVSGNAGRNIFFLLALALINLVFFCLVLYKGIEIHELAQFTTYFADERSPVDLWEQWRRSSASLTKPMRSIVLALTSGFPGLLAVCFIGFLFYVIYWDSALIQPRTDVVVHGSAARVAVWSVLIAHIALIGLLMRSTVAISNKHWKLLREGRTIFSFPPFDM
jgi:hypothetical protein